MCRALFLGVLLLLTPALVLGQEDKEKKDAATDKAEPVKVAPEKDKTEMVKQFHPVPQPAWMRWGQAVFSVLVPVLLALIAIILIGLRSDISKAVDRMQGGGGGGA